ncbi:MAG: hypothetical protein ACJ798_16120 [Phenylobacterium sp.]
MTSAWIGVRGLERWEALERLRLVDTGRAADVQNDLLALTESPKGWTIIRSLKFAYPTHKRLAKLSLGADVVAALFQVGVGVSGAEGWRGGRMTWSVSHQVWNGVYDLVVKGDPPSVLRDIDLQQRDYQDRAGGTPADGDFVFMTPLFLAREVCGYFPTEGSELDFTALEPAPSLLARVFRRGKT